MKAYTLSAIATLTGVVTVGPTNGYDLAEARDVANLDTAPDMTFTGPLHVGGPNVTVQTIYAQIHKANPEYNPWDFDEYREHMNELGITEESDSISTLAKRQHVCNLPHSHNSDSNRIFQFECNPVGKQVANWPMQCAEGIDYLRALNGYCSAPAGPAGCARVSCSHGCGIHLCNDVSVPLPNLCQHEAGLLMTLVEQLQD